MRFTPFGATLAIVAGVSALPQHLQGDQNATQAAPAIPAHVFASTPKFVEVLTFEAALEKFNTTTTTTKTSNKDLPQLSDFESFKVDDVQAGAATASGTCSNPRYRTEWDSMGASDRMSFINAIKCLMGRPASGNFPGAQSRYEDIVSLHQTLTNVIHGNDIFLFWHRYYVWTLEDILRQECGFSTDMPWFDETKYAGNFPASSIFTSNYFGSLTSGGNCVTDSQFNNAQSNGVGVVNLDIGPGNSDTPHCLSRDYNQNAAGYTSQQYVDLCNNQTDYHNMRQCQEGGPHANGHVGIGGVMNDIYGSPGDTVFFLHHGFVDKNFQSWQYQDPNNRLTSNGVDGQDASGNPVTLSTTITMNGLRPDVTIGQLLDTQGSLLCYNYR